MFEIIALALLAFMALSLYRIANSLAEIRKLGVVAVVRGHMGPQIPIRVFVQPNEGGPV